MSPVAQSHVAHVPHAEPVDEGDARLDVVDDTRPGRGQLDDRAVLGQHDRVWRDAALLRQPRVSGQHPELAVHRHHRLRSHERDHRPQLLGVPVARDVHRGVLLVQHLGPRLGELVDCVVHAQLVPGHRPRRDDHGVAAVDVHRRMVVVGDPHERRERLALRARAEDQHLAGRVFLQLDRPDQRVLGHVDVAEVAGDVEVLAHRPADHADLAPDLDCDVDRLLHAVDVRREGSDEDSARPLRDDLAEGLADETLGAGDARTLGVRRVGEQQVDAAVAELREPADVGAEAVHGRVVELPVAGVNDAAGGRLEHDGDAVRHRMRHADERDAERTDV